MKHNSTLDPSNTKLPLLTGRQSGSANHNFDFGYVGARATAAAAAHAAAIGPQRTSQRHQTKCRVSTISIERLYGVTCLQSRL
jgi:hypothetical protein